MYPQVPGLSVIFLRVYKRVPEGKIINILWFMVNRKGTYSLSWAYFKVLWLTTVISKISTFFPDGEKERWNEE